jgi:hypothetical protein
MTQTQYAQDGKQRSYAVFFHFRHDGAQGGHDGQQYSLDVRATTAQRAINKVIAEQMAEYSISKSLIVIDEVSYEGEVNHKGEVMR